MRAGRPWKCTRSCGELDPAADVLLVAEQLEDRLVRRVDVGRIARQRDPPERPLALAEERPDVGGHEAGIGEGVVVAVVGGDAAQRVAVVERLGAAPAERADRVDVREHGLARRARR